MSNPPSSPPAPAGTLEALEEAAARFLAELWAYNERRNAPQLSMEEINAEIAAAYAESRERRRQRAAATGDTGL